MITILGSPYFLDFCIPLITVALSIFLKYVTRNDQHRAFRKEDLAVGLDVAATALILFITDSVSVAAAFVKSAQPTVTADNKLVTAPWVIAAFVIGIWGVSTIVRKVGWKSEDELTLLWGIVVPNIYGIAVLIFVVHWIGS
jgi:uncharacterized membrane protein YgcG